MASSVIFVHKPLSFFWYQIQQLRTCLLHLLHMTQIIKYSIFFNLYFSHQKISRNLEELHSEMKGTEGIRGWDTENKIHKLGEYLKKPIYMNKGKIYQQVTRSSHIPYTSLSSTKAQTFEAILKDLDIMSKRWENSHKGCWRKISESETHVIQQYI